LRERKDPAIKKRRKDKKLTQGSKKNGIKKIEASMFRRGSEGGDLRGRGAGE